MTDADFLRSLADTMSGPTGKRLREIADRLDDVTEERKDWARRFMLDGVTPWDWQQRALKAERKHMPPPEPKRKFSPFACSVCGKNSAEGYAIYRISPKGQAFVGVCDEHRTFEVSGAPDVAKMIQDAQHPPSPQTPAETEVAEAIAWAKRISGMDTTNNDVRIYLRTLVDKVVNSQGSPVDKTQNSQGISEDQVICPNCVHQFRAIPVNVQERIAELERAAVPREPTEAMQKAGMEAMFDDGGDVKKRELYLMLRKAWRAMYDAAQPTSAPADKLQELEGRG